MISRNNILQLNNVFLNMNDLSLEEMKAIKKGWYEPVISFHDLGDRGNFTLMFTSTEKNSEKNGLKDIHFIKGGRRNEKGIKTNKKRSLSLQK